MYLLDTMVVSEIRKRQSNPRVRLWLTQRKQESFFLSVVRLYEIRKGICAQERGNPDLASGLALWLEGLRLQFKDRILPVSEEIAEEWGRLAFITRNSGPDNLLTATAKIHRPTVVTRNARHFQPTGVACINPWAEPFHGLSAPE